MKFVEKLILNPDPIEKLPDDLKEKGRELSRIVGKVWNEKGELLIQGEPIRGTDIVRIFRYYLEKKGDLPAGYIEFLVLLDEIGHIRVKPPGVLDVPVVKWTSLKKGRK